MKRFLPSAILMTGLLFGGCAPKVATQVTMPAKSQEAAEIKSVAVFPFDGNYGRQTSADIETVLAGAEVDGKKYFTVVDRQNINKLMSEQKLQTSGVIDLNTAVKLGKIIGAQGVYVGNADYSSNDSGYTESRSKCSSTDSKGHCKSYYNYNVSCVKRTVNLNVIPKLIDVATGQIRYSEKLVSADSSSRCSDSSHALLSSGELVKNVSVNVMDQFRRDVAPYNATVYIEIIDKTDGITDGNGKNTLKYGIDFAKNGRLDRACELWKQGEQGNPASLSFAYNVGICYEAEGNYEAALAQYNKADKLTMKPVTAINNALSRIKQRIADKDKLKSQLSK